MGLGEKQRKNQAGKHGITEKFWDMDMLGNGGGQLLKTRSGCALETFPGFREEPEEGPEAFREWEETGMGDPRRHRKEFGIQEGTERNVGSRNVQIGMRDPGKVRQECEIQEAAEPFPNNPCPFQPLTGFPFCP